LSAVGACGNLARCRGIADKVGSHWGKGEGEGIADRVGSHRVRLPPGVFFSRQKTAGLRPPFVRP